jgi:hypothetical protein
MTRSRCGAGTLSTPLSRSHDCSLPSPNQDNDNTVSDTTYLPRKTGQRWEKLSEPVATYRPVASSYQICSRDRGKRMIFVIFSFYHDCHQKTVYFMYTISFSYLWNNILICLSTLLLFFFGQLYTFSTTQHH